MPHLQLKDIPAGVHEALRSKAAANGISMREDVLRLIEADVGPEDDARGDGGDEKRLPKARPSAPSAAELVEAGRRERDERLSRLFDRDP